MQDNQNLHPSDKEEDKQSEHSVHKQEGNTICLTLDELADCENPESQLNEMHPKEVPFQLSIQPFQNCAKRQIWEAKYAQFFKLDVDQEKQKLLEKRKPPRKPLSPYIFFSQEKRKDIKKRQKNLTAKQIMKLVSKYWQEIKDNKDMIEKYEYLSLRDREAYSILRRFYSDLPGQAPFESPENGIAAAVSRTSTQRISLQNLEKAKEQLPSDTHSEARNTCMPDKVEAAEPRKSSFSSITENKLIPKKRGRKSLSKEVKEARKKQRDLHKHEPAKHLLEKERSKSDNYIIQPYSPSGDNNQRVEKICSQLTNNFSKSSFDIPSLENLTKGNTPFSRNAPVQIPLTQLDQKLFTDFDYNLKAEPQFETGDHSQQKHEQIEIQNLPTHKYPTLYPDFDSDQPMNMRSLNSNDPLNDPLTPLMGKNYIEQGQQGNQSYMEQEQDPDNSYNNSLKNPCFFGEPPTVLKTSNNNNSDDQINQQLIQTSKKAEFQQQILNNQRMLINILDVNKLQQSGMMTSPQTQYQQQELRDQLQVQENTDVVAPPSSNLNLKSVDENQLLGDFLKFQNMMLLQQLQQNILSSQQMLQPTRTNEAPIVPNEHGRQVVRPPLNKTLGRPPKKNKK